MTYPVATFQKTVNINNALGVVGELAFDGPRRAAPYNLFSNGTPNVIGNVFTITSGDNPDPNPGSTLAGTAQVGGTGVFAGILVSPKEYASFGGATGPLSPTITLSDYSIGQLLTMGEIFVYLPGPASVGDLIVYDPLTGNLDSMAPTASFTAAIAPGGSAGVNDVMTVSAITVGNLGVGALVTGAGVAGGTFISSLGTGKGGTGTYNLSTINEQTVSSEAMTANNTPVLAFTGAGYIAGTTLTVTTASTGELEVGQVITGAGVAPNTQIIARGSGEGGTGTYTVSISQTVGSSGTPISISGPSYTLVPRAEVSRFAVTAAGLACIKLTN